MALASLTNTLFPCLPLCRSIALSCRSVSLHPAAPLLRLISIRSSCTSPSTSASLFANLLDVEPEVEPLLTEPSTPLPEPETVSEPESVISDEVTEATEEGTEKEGEKEKEKEKVRIRRYAVPVLTSKEKRALAAHAHTLGKKLKYQQIGKFGITAALATSFIQTLEANELLKLKVLANCSEDMLKIIKQLEESTGSVAVSKIGRVIILYRPSLTKMKKEEEAKQRALNTKPIKKPFRKPPSEFQSKATPSFGKFKKEGEFRKEFAGDRRKSYKKPWSNSNNNFNSFNGGARKGPRRGGI